VREVVELLLKAQNRWPEILKHYEVSDRQNRRANDHGLKIRPDGALDFVSVAHW